MPGQQHERTLVSQWLIATIITSSGVMPYICDMEVSLPSNNRTEHSNAKEITTNSTEDGARDHLQWVAARGLELVC